MNIGILTAMQSEFNLLADLLENPKKVNVNQFEYTCGKLGDNEIILKQCGIGKVNAAIGTTELIKSFSPDCIISTGVAGGIDQCVNVMDVVVSEKTVYHDVWCGMGCEKGQIQGFPTTFTSDKHLLDIALNLNNKTTKIHGGLICTGDQFITNHSELNTIKSHFPDGLAVDMESCSIAHTCYIYQVPFISFRIISDTPGVENHEQQYEDFWGTMSKRSFEITKKFIESI
ncbi:MAG: 5'-methylthioadenosine/adenosylhomocysteine nucleosidase [Bacteroidaceae bacterium]|nr:5'-methylthioadenosine/adenosylhomocysteine nucleosidase [Bacteroidaceae bacterium]